MNGGTSEDRADQPENYGQCTSQTYVIYEGRHDGVVVPWSAGGQRRAREGYLSGRPSVAPCARNERQQSNKRTKRTHERQTRRFTTMPFGVCFRMDFISHQQAMSCRVYVGDHGAATNNLQSLKDATSPVPSPLHDHPEYGLSSLGIHAGED